MRISTYISFVSAALLCLPVLAQTQPVKGGIAQEVTQSGQAKIIKSGVVQTITPQQRFATGDVVELAKGARLEINYDNGCGEVFSQARQYTVDACKCLTSPFRKDRTDKYNATLKNVSGDVLIYQGVKYQPARSGMRIRNGDRVMAMRGAGAKIIYDHGCVSSVDSFTIHDVDGCKACPLPKEQPVQETQLAQQEAVTQPAQQTATAPSQPAVPPALPSPPVAVSVPTASTPPLLNNPGFWGTLAAAALIPELKHDHDDNRSAVSP